MNNQKAETLYLTTISIAELRHGIAALPEGRRSRHLASVLADRILPLFGSRILPFDDAAASACVDVRLRVREAGKAIGAADSYIAAIAGAHGFAIATRDGTPFVAAGLNVVDPWQSVNA
jgi:predicted nucleic acid-binding protein